MSSLTIIDHLQPQLPRDILTPSDLCRSKVILVLQCRHSSTGFSIRKLFSEKETNQRLFSFLCAKVSFYRQNYENPKRAQDSTVQVLFPSCHKSILWGDGISVRGNSYISFRLKIWQIAIMPREAQHDKQHVKKNFCCGMTNYSVFASFSCFCFWLAKIL